MPDWSYQTVLRPMLFRLRPEAGRDVALGAMGLLARLPGGNRVIQFLGHMGPDERLCSERDGLTFASPVGLGCRVDPRLAATRAFAEFGFGYIEIGPIRSDSPAAPGTITRNDASQELHFAAPQASLTLADARRRLAEHRPSGVRILARIEPASPADAAAMVDALTPVVDVLVVPWDAYFAGDFENSDGAARPLWAAISAEQWNDAATRTDCERAVRSGRVAGLVVDPPASPDGDRVLGAAGLAAGLATVRAIRAALGPDVTIVAGVGVHEPADALDCVEAGADLVQVDSGLVFAGPGLPKRINDALLYRKLQLASGGCNAGRARLLPSREPDAKRLSRSFALPLVGAPRPATQSWFWALLLGLSLLGGGLLALAIAATRVVLPYDESLTGLSRDALLAINPRLLDFMKHDRVTLAGTMLAVGIQYVALAACGVRRGMHWAYVTVVASALAGFFTFFAFLGFGYFDPFHAFVSAVLLQLTLLAMLAQLPAESPSVAPDLHNNEAWRSHQWGQLLFVVHGAALLTAGVVITAIGMTSVFIPEDLEFLGTTVDALVGAHPQLRPLVAHDRATFGGMLIACGVATLLPALWGFRRGQAWLWWTLMVAGNIAYLAAIAVHMDVGYSSHKHLLPAYGGLATLWAGGLFSYPFLAARDEALEAEWKTRLIAH